MGMTAHQTAEIVMRIYGVNGRTPTAPQLEAWHDCIKEVDWDIAVQAAKEMMTTDDGFPTVARFMGYVERSYLGGSPSVDRARTEVIEAILEVGSYEVPSWSHPAIARAVASIGWKDICASEGDWWKAWFNTAYENERKRTVTDHRLAITSGNAANPARIIDTSGLFAIEP